MKMKIAFTLLTLGLLGTSAQAQVLTNPYYPVGPVVHGTVAGGLVGNGEGGFGVHSHDLQTGTGAFVVGKGTGVHFNRFRHGFAQPTSRTMDYGSGPAHNIIWPTYPVVRPVPMR
jgi:hypothetical protein